MAIKKDRLIHYLEKTVDLLKSTSHYEWGNSGACNCGHLAQVITGHKGSDIHRWSLEKHGEWTDKADLYCENSGYKIDNVITIMLKAGLQILVHHTTTAMDGRPPFRLLPPSPRLVCCPIS